MDISKGERFDNYRQYNRDLKNVRRKARKEYLDTRYQYHADKKGAMIAGTGVGAASGAVIGSLMGNNLRTKATGRRAIIGAGLGAVAGAADSALIAHKGRKRFAKSAFGVEHGVGKALMPINTKQPINPSPAGASTAAMAPKAASATKAPVSPMTGPGTGAQMSAARRSPNATAALAAAPGQMKKPAAMPVTKRMAECAECGKKANCDKSGCCANCTKISKAFSLKPVQSLAAKAPKAVGTKVGQVASGLAPKYKAARPIASAAQRNPEQMGRRILGGAAAVTGLGAGAGAGAALNKPKSKRSYY